MKIGFVGLGNMGAPMAANIAAAGFDVIGFDAAGTEQRLPAGVGAGQSLEHVIRHADTVLLSVPDGAVSLSIVDAIISTDSRSTTVVIDLSTVGPVAAQEAARRLSTVGVTYVDGPVSGGVAGAKARTISLMFGGPGEVFDIHQTLLESFAGNVFHVGEEAGHGQAMKLLNNFLSATALAASSEALALGRAYGLDLETMLDVVNVSTGRNSATYDKFPNRVLTGTYDTGFFTHLMAKDVRLFNSVAAEIGSPHSVSQSVGDVWNACERAMPGSDFSEIWKFVGQCGPVSADLTGRMQDFQRCIETRDSALAEQLLDDDFALELVHPTVAEMPRQRWLEVLSDYVVHAYEVEQMAVDVDGDAAVVLQRVTMQATVLGQDRSGCFVITDIWRLRGDGWRLWRRHSTPLAAGNMPETEA